MKINRKSQGISLTTVVIAAVALIVLIVLILIFTGRLDIFNRGLSECPPGSSEKTNADLAGWGGACSENGTLPTKTIKRNNTLAYCCP